MMINPVDFVAGLLIIVAGIVTILGMVNFGVVIGTIGLLIEAIKIMIQQGF